MPAKKTLNGDVLPALWVGLGLDSRETERNVNRATFHRILETSGTIVTPRIVDRMWDTLATSSYAHHSPYADAVLILDVRAIAAALIASGRRSLVGGNTHTTHTYTHTETSEEADQ